GRTAMPRSNKLRACYIRQIDELVSQTTVEKGHGRIETRTYTASSKVDWITSERSYPGQPRFKNIKSLGRSISTLPPWKPILPFVFPQRCARRSWPRAWRGPQIACAS